MTIKVAMAPKSKSPRPSKIVRESPERTPSPISRPADAPAGDGEFSDDDSAWEGLTRSNQQIHRDDLMEGVEKMVRDTMSDVFASRDGKEGKRAASVAVHPPRRYSDEGTNPPLLLARSSPAALHPAIFSLVGHGWKRKQSSSSQTAISKLTDYQSSIVRIIFETLTSKSH